jgi:hypothetical protein
MITPARRRTERDDGMTEHRHGARPRSGVTGRGALSFALLVRVADRRLGGDGGTSSGCSPAGRRRLSRTGAVLILLAGSMLEP